LDILLLGPPGAGKGTQGALLSQRTGLPRFATGDLLRDAVTRETPLGLAAKAIMESGDLVRDDVILGIVHDQLLDPSAARGVIFDGVVRTVPQAEGVDTLLRQLGRRLDRVIFLDVSDQEVLERINRRRDLEGRADDSPEALVRRLQAYRSQTAPVLAWYDDRIGVTRVPAQGTIEEVAERIAKVIETPA
jgi:adenylate kinase